MAENGNRGPNDFRARNGRRRREPAIIDASATEVPVDPVTPAAGDGGPAPGAEPGAEQADASSPHEATSPHSASLEPASPEPAGPEFAPSEAAEPVLFGGAVREHALTSEPIEGSGGTPAIVEDETRAASGDAPSAAAASAPDAAPRDAAMRPEDPASPAWSAGASEAPPVPGSPGRRGSGAAAWLLTLATLVLLGSLAWVLFTQPQRSGQAEIAELRDKVAALEARPDPSRLQDAVAALDGRATAADADRAGLAKTVADLTTRLDAISQQAQKATAPPEADIPVAPAPAAPSTSVPAPDIATAGALSALATKVDTVESRVEALSTAQGETARALADLPKPATPDLGPLDTKLAALDGRVTALDGKANGGDARINAFDAKVNGVDGKINGFDARMNVFENRTNGIDAKVNGIDTRVGTVAATADSLGAKVGVLDARVGVLDGAAKDTAGGLAKLQAAVADLPRLDLAPLEAATSALDGRVAGLDGRVAEVEGQLVAPKDGVRATEARAVGSADETRAAPIALVGQAVGRAIADGLPYASDLDALKALGAEPDALAKLSPLAAKGAPTVPSLRDDWGAVKGDVLAALKPAGPDSAFDRFAASARALVQVRRIGAVAGDDPAAVVSQVDAALEAGDVPGALAAWGRLPQPGQDKSRDWAAAARAQVDAAGAARSLVGHAIATLGRTKS